MPTLVSVALSKRYSAPLCSRACLAAATVATAALILPLVLAYSSSSFWKKENSYREQPHVAFTHSLLVQVDGASTRSSAVPVPFTATWSTDPLYNKMLTGIVRTPIVKTADVDENRDGKNDYLTFTVTVPVFAGENVLHARLGFIFQYSLETSIRLSMETMGLLDYTYPFPASKLTLQGDLRLFQRRIFIDRTTHIDEDGPVFNKSRVGTTAWTVEGMVAEYMDRDVRTDVIAPYPIWKSGRGPNEPFVITGKIRYSEDRIYFRPGALEELKHAWIQYLAFFFLALVLAIPSLTFLVQNRFVPTRVTVDQVPVGLGPHKLHQF